MARKTLILEDAKILFRNFSGERFNTPGIGDVSLVIAPADVEPLMNEGWSIKEWTPTDDDGNALDDPTPFLKAKVRYDKVPPAIYIVTSGGPTLLDEETVKELDNAEITMVDCILVQAPWAVGGKEGIAAYVQEMFVTIRESRFAEKYGVHHRR